MNPETVPSLIPLLLTWAGAFFMSGLALGFVAGRWAKREDRRHADQ